MLPEENDVKPVAGTSHGFSLLELMVVLVILAILAMIQYPTYMESVRKSKRAEGRAALTELMQQQERYYSQHGSYVAFSAAEPSGFKWYSGNTPENSSYEITGSRCKEDTLRNCIVLLATPGTDKVNAAFRDHVCGKLSLASNGVKAASGHGTQCW